jgi:hypothetical protein
MAMTPNPSHLRTLFSCALWAAIIVLALLALSWLPLSRIAVPWATLWLALGAPFALAITHASLYFGLAGFALLFGLCVTRRSSLERIQVLAGGLSVVAAVFLVTGGIVRLVGTYETSDLDFLQVQTETLIKAYPKAYAEEIDLPPERIEAWKTVFNKILYDSGEAFRKDLHGDSLHPRFTRITGFAPARHAVRLTAVLSQPECRQLATRDLSGFVPVEVNGQSVSGPLVCPHAFFNTVVVEGVLTPSPDALRWRQNTQRAYQERLLEDHAWEERQGVALFEAVEDRYNTCLDAAQRNLKALQVCKDTRQKERVQVKAEVKRQHPDANL